MFKKKISFFTLLTQMLNTESFLRVRMSTHWEAFGECLETPWSWLPWDPSCGRPAVARACWPRPNEVSHHSHLPEYCWMKERVYSRQVTKTRCSAWSRSTCSSTSWGISRKPYPASKTSRSSRVAAMCRLASWYILPSEVHPRHGASPTRHRARVDWPQWPQRLALKLVFNIYCNDQHMKTTKTLTQFSPFFCQIKKKWKMW